VSPLHLGCISAASRLHVGCISAASRLVELAGDLMLRHAREQRCDDPAAFRRGMRNLVESARAGERGAFNLRHLKVGEVLLEVTSLVRTHHVQPDPVFTTLVCAIVVLEGLGRQLDPTLDLFSVGLPLLVGA